MTCDVRLFMDNIHENSQVTGQVPLQRSREPAPPVLSTCGAVPQHLNTVPYTMEYDFNFPPFNY